MSDDRAANITVHLPNGGGETATVLRATVDRGDSDAKDTPPGCLTLLRVGS